MRPGMSSAHLGKGDGAGVGMASLKSAARKVQAEQRAKKSDADNDAETFEVQARPLRDQKGSLAAQDVDFNGGQPKLTQAPHATPSRAPAAVPTTRPTPSTFPP